MAYAKKERKETPPMNRLTRISLALAATAAVTATTTAVAAAAPVKTTKSAANSIFSGPAQGTGGLILRNANGTDLGSGIGEGQGFYFLSCGPKGSGLIKVRQHTRGTGGGWGNLYTGYVKQRYTQIPSMFPC